jgi:hypothetical protein
VAAVITEVCTVSICRPALEHPLRPRTPHSHSAFLVCTYGVHVHAPSQRPCARLLTFCIAASHHGNSHHLGPVRMRRTFPSDALHGSTVTLPSIQSLRTNVRAQAIYRHYGVTRPASRGPSGSLKVSFQVCASAVVHQQKATAFSPPLGHMLGLPSSVRNPQLGS